MLYVRIDKVQDVVCKSRNNHYSENNKKIFKEYFVIRY